MNKLSVIIPIFNAEKYLKDCLESLLFQDFDGFEVICVDDGSTDGSLLIAKSYQNKFRKFKLLKQKNSGAGSARNLGLEFSKSHFLYFMDADDVFDKEFPLQSVVEKAIQNQLDLVIFEASFWNEIKKERISWCIYKKNVPQKKIFSNEDIRGNLFHITGSEIWNKLYSRNLIESNKIRFQNLSNANDVYFSFVALAKAKKISCFYQNGLLYRKHGTSTQATKYKNPTCIVQAIEALNERLNEELTSHRGCNISFTKWKLGVLHFNFRTMNNKVALVELFSQTKHLFAGFDPADKVFLDDHHAILLSYILANHKIPIYILAKELKNPKVEAKNTYFFPLIWLGKRIKSKLNLLIK